MSPSPADPLSPGRCVLFSNDPSVRERLLATGLVPTVQLLSPESDLGALPTLRPDSILLAHASDDPELLVLLRSLRPRLGRRRLLALSPQDDSEHVVACLHAGAEAFVSLRDVHQLAARLAGALATLRSHPRRPMDHRFKTLADAAPALVWITDDAADFIHFNRPWIEFTGRSRDQEMIQGWLDGIYPEDRARFCNEFGHAFRKREAFRLDFRLRRHDGLYRWITCQGVPHYEDDEVFTGFIGSCLDVSDQHEAETLLAYRAITQSALAGFGRFALGQHTLQEIKQEATRVLCDTLHLAAGEVLLFDPPDSARLVRAYATGVPSGVGELPMEAARARAEGETRLRLDDDGEIFPGRENHAALAVRSAFATPIHDSATTIGFLTGLSTEPRSFDGEAFNFIQAIATIISTVHQRAKAESALQASETKLLQSQKMEAVGQLAGGVAHDFNNLLTAVRCYADMLHHDLGDLAPELRSKTSEILKAADRASSLTRQLLAFSRKQVLQPETLDMNAVIADLRELVRSLLSENVNLDVRLLEDHACFFADRNQIDQVVLNLCLNARDAMPQGGVLSLDVGAVEIAADNPHHIAAGPYVRLTVRDTGVGMDPEVQSHLFQPFFTTKPVGRGTGLGLATCAVIVKNCNGLLTFESEVGKGTSFHLFLPRIPAPGFGLYSEEQEPVLNGREHILVVEDDEAIRQITFAILDSLGYRVTVVPGGADALRLFSEGNLFELLVTDVIMPEINGLELAQTIRDKFQPGIRIMFMSGYLGNAETVRAVAEYNLPFLEKPFTLSSLARKVRETLDAPPAALPR